MLKICCLPLSQIEDDGEFSRTYSIILKLYNITIIVKLENDTDTVPYLRHLPLSFNYKTVNDDYRVHLQHAER